jgi:hypothetical protein
VQIPTEKIFSLNPATTPQIIYGDLDPGVDYGEDALTVLPTGSIYLQIIETAGVVTSSAGWYKNLSDEAADTLLISPWTLFSNPGVTVGDDAIDYASDEFVAYLPGMIHVVAETKPTGEYRTAWMKVSVGGERANWISLAESEAIEYIVAAITRTGSWTVTATSDWATPTWADVATGTPTVLTDSTNSSGLVGSAMALTIQTSGVYRIDAQVSMLATGSPTKGQLAVKVGSTYHVLGQAPTATDKTLVINGSIVLELTAADILVAAGAHDGSDGAITAARLGVQMIGPTPA